MRREKHYRREAQMPRQKEMEQHWVDCLPKEKTKVYRSCPERYWTPDWV